MTRISFCLSLALCLVFGGCSSTMNPYRPSFVEMARQASYESGGGGGKTISANGGVSWDYERDRYAELKFSDQLALNYANEMANILRPKFNRSRIVREVAGTAQVAMAGASGATAAFNLSNTTLAVLGLGGAGIPELQRIFNAKGRAENYQVAVNMIEDAVIEYLSFNQTPSSTYLTQNGVSVVHRTNAAIHIVEQSLAGMLPSVQQMQQATERMSEAGARQTPRGPAVNNVAANPVQTTVKSPPPPPSQRMEFDPDAQLVIETPVMVDVQEDQRVLARWVGERARARDFGTLQAFIKEGGVKEPVSDAEVATRARLIVRDATTRSRVDLLLNASEAASVATAPINPANPPPPPASPRQ